MSNTSIKIKEITAEVLGIPASEVKDASTFESLNADYHDIITIFMEVERECNLNKKIDDELANEKTTVEELVKHVEQLQADYPEPMN
jgi:acyl carrier protein